MAKTNKPAAEPAEEKKPAPYGTCTNEDDGGKVCGKALLAPIDSGMAAKCPVPSHN